VRMTTVRPVSSQFGVIKESTREGLIQRPSRHVFVVSPTDVTGDVSDESNKDADDVGFFGEPFADNGELLSSLSPLLTSMKLFGLYFQRPDRHQRPTTDDPEWNSATASTGKASTKLRVYATVVLMLVWLSAIRCVFVFTSGDRFGALLLMKITVFTWCALVAIFQTTCYYASHTGKLLKILSTLRVTRDCVRSVRRAAIVLTALLWLTMVCFLTIGAAVFLNSDEEFNFILAPFVTYIHVPERSILIARVIGYLGYIMVYPCVFFSHLLSLVLVYIFYTQFKKLKKNFRRALGERGQFNGDLSLFRRRHMIN